ncbi:hypothetical protein [Demequina sp.]|uniref:hypothetical protein n=1 Tax=Demequina sp. TaxID=2050685 RepID=UPI003A8676F6
MSGAFAPVLAQLRGGASPGAAARAVGVHADFALAVAQEATRLGLIAAADTGCGTCVPQASLACAACPLASERGR